MLLIVICDTGEQSCAACGIGQYQDTAGQVKCKGCDAGRYGTLQGSSEICKACEQGTFQDKTSKSECEKCPAGNYNEERGATTNSSCKMCPRGSTIQVLDPDVVSIHQSLFAHQEIIGKRMQTGVLAVIKASIYQILSKKNQV